MKILVISEWEKSDIEWQQRNREKANITIQKFMEWQRKGWPKEEIQSLLFDIEVGIFELDKERSAGCYTEDFIKMKEFILENFDTEISFYIDEQSN